MEFPQKPCIICEIQNNDTMRHQIPTDPHPDALFREKVRAIIAELCEGLGRVDARFVEEAIYGIAQSGSVRLTAISHALNCLLYTSPSPRDRG